MRLGGVQEYADAHGKSRDEIYRHIKSGRLKAEKVSGVYLLDLYQPYPKDARFTTGEYVDWRKK